uniref:Uncharacterized protein n=1 Tax=Arundo donax TaxID=35708 RepID=A0A0A9U0E6_ARUDO
MSLDEDVFSSKLLVLVNGHRNTIIFSHVFLLDLAVVHMYVRGLFACYLCS